MPSIVLEDLENKQFQVLNYLSEERDYHIRGNIIELNKIVVNYVIYDYDINLITDLKYRELTQDQGLYEKRINEYNKKTLVTGKPLLIAWIR